MTEPEVGTWLKDSADRNRCAGELVVGPDESATFDGLGLNDLKRQSHGREARWEANADPPFLARHKHGSCLLFTTVTRSPKNVFWCWLLVELVDALALGEVRS
jgi:hypothetical protein